jgi:hypothetical protein
MSRPKKKRIYAQWPGDKKGIAENPKNCIEVVYKAPTFIGHQCSRKRGYGEQDLYCLQHGEQTRHKIKP